MKTNIPFTVIGGYLGAGKTTLLNHILHQNDGQRFALLINDFGDINIDAELIESQDDEIMQLSNGCICCSLAAEFLVGMNTILEQDPLPDRVIVEASGVSDPKKIAPYGQTPGFSLDGVIVVVDAETVRDKAKDKYVGRTVNQQLKSADLILLNKTDLVNEQQKQEVMDWLAQTAPQCRLIEAQYGAVPIQFLLGYSTRLLTADFENFSQGQAYDAAYQSWSYVDDKPLTRSQIECFVAGLPDSVLRAKGVLYLEDEPQRRMIFQLVGQRWSLTPGEGWDRSKQENRLVVIGAQDRIDLSELSSLLEECTRKTSI
jgi:G3E family GTPase